MQFCNPEIQGFQKNIDSICPKFGTEIVPSSYTIMRSEIAANLNVFEFVKIFGEIFKTLGVRWSNRYGVTAPLTT